MANDNPMAQLAVDGEIDVSAVFAMRTPVNITGGSGATVEGTIISAPDDRLVISLDQGAETGDGLRAGAELTIEAASDGSDDEASCSLLEIEELAAVRLVTSRPSGVHRQVPLATSPWTTLLQDCSVYMAARLDSGPGHAVYPVAPHVIQVEIAKGHCVDPGGLRPVHRRPVLLVGAGVGQLDRP